MTATSPIIVQIPDTVVFVDVPTQRPLCGEGYGATGPEGPAGPAGATGPQGPKGDPADTGRYGSFYDTTTQSGSLTAKVVALNSTTSAVGTSITGTGRIVIDTPGTYKLTFSIQLMNVDNTTHYADIWLKYNGSNYPYSNTRFHVPARKSSTEYGYSVAVVDFIGTSQAANDFVELYWVVDSTQVSIPTIAPWDGVPATPGVIVNISQVA